MPDLGSLIESQGEIVEGWQERAAKATHAPAAAEIGKALAVAIDKYATLKAIEREEPRRPELPPPPMRFEP